MEKNFQDGASCKIIDYFLNRNLVMWKKDNIFSMLTSNEKITGKKDENKYFKGIIYSIYTVVVYST